MFIFAVMVVFVVEAFVVVNGAAVAFGSSSPSYDFPVNSYPPPLETDLQASANNYFDGYTTYQGLVGDKQSDTSMVTLCFAFSISPLLYGVSPGPQPPAATIEDDYYFTPLSGAAAVVKARTSPFLDNNIGFATSKLSKDLITWSTDVPGTLPYVFAVYTDPTLIPSDELNSRVYIIYDPENLAKKFPKVMAEQAEDGWFPPGAAIKVVGKVEKVTVNYPSNPVNFPIVSYAIVSRSLSSLTSVADPTQKIKNILKITNSKRSLSLANIPLDWICPESYYGRNDGCDCGCGNFDPDCAGVTNRALTHCRFDGECDAQTGSCPPPYGWTCSNSYYDTRDGCDCNCGSYDPDCSTQQVPMYGCPGKCLNVSGMACCHRVVPAGWTCDPSHYGSNDGCQCNCGVMDPDCEDPYYDCQQVCSPTNGLCYHVEFPPPSWRCNEETFGTGDGCDCNCGVHDPDCDSNNYDPRHCPCRDMTCQRGFCVGLCNGVMISLALHNNVCNIS